MQLQELVLLAVNWQEGLFFVKENQHIFVINTPYDKLDNKRLSSMEELESALVHGKVEDIRALDMRYFSYSTLTTFIEEKMEEVFYDDENCTMSDEELENFLHELPIEAIELFVEDLEQEMSMKCYSVHQYDFAITLSEAPSLRSDALIQERLEKVIQALQKHHLLFDLPKPGRVGDASSEETTIAGTTATDIGPEIGQARGNSQEGLAY